MPEGVKQRRRQQLVFLGWGGRSSFYFFTLTSWSDNNSFFEPNIWRQALLKILILLIRTTCWSHVLCWLSVLNSDKIQHNVLFKWLKNLFWFFIPRQRILKHIRAAYVVFIRSIFIFWTNFKMAGSVDKNWQKHELNPGHLFNLSSQLLDLHHGPWIG